MSARNGHLNNIVYFLTGQGIDPDHPEKSNFSIDRATGEIYVRRVIWSLFSICKKRWHYESLKLGSGGGCLRSLGFQVRFPESRRFIRSYILILGSSSLFPLLLFPSLHFLHNLLASYFQFHLLNSNASYKKLTNGIPASVHYPPPNVTKLEINSGDLRFLRARRN